LSEVLKPLAFRSHLKGLELAFRVAPDVPDLLLADPVRLRQVIVNLVGNAIKFTSVGEVVVSVSRLQIADCRLQIDKTEDAPGADPPGNLQSAICNLQFDVRDTGIGIPADKLASIFHPFEQADGSHTRKYGGTGLGLSISARLVELMGGAIGVHSAVGRGSQFHFTLPLTQPAEPGTGAEPAAEGLRNRRVLLVDDSGTSRAILAEMLAGWGMHVAQAASAHEACALLEQSREAPFDLAVVDGSMPEVDGLDFLERVQRSPTLRAALRGPALVLLSSPDRQAETSRCRALGVPRFLVKPAGAGELLAALGDLLLEPGTEAVEVEHRRQSRRALRILLAEDNVVNQKLASRLLEKKGHTVTVVATGREAVSAQISQPHDLILMDQQMPDLDGLEATALIRAAEAHDQHVPIVALTAHAMKGDRERCLEAGMDAYLSKPLRSSDLFALLDSFFPAEGIEPAPPSDDAGAFDEIAFRQSLGDDDDLCRDLIETFQKQAPVLCAQIRAAITERHGPALQRAAHTLKGSLRVFADRATPVLEQLEERGREGHWQGIDALRTQLEDDLARLQTALADVLQRLGQECAA
jgi:CheY-like chemotaxis protein